MPSNGTRFTGERSSTDEFDSDDELLEYIGESSTSGDGINPNLPKSPSKIWLFVSVTFLMLAIGGSIAICRSQLLPDADSPGLAARNTTIDQSTVTITTTTATSTSTSSSTTATTTTTTTTMQGVSALQASVIVMRHCPRSTHSHFDPPVTEVTTPYDDFSEQPFPQWPVASYNCLPSATEGLATLAAQLQPLPEPVHIVSDSVSRDIDTANALNLSDAITVDTGPFNPPCPGLPAQHKAALMKSALHELPLEMIVQLTSTMQTVVLGNNTNSHVSRETSVSSDAILTGALPIAGNFAERFLMQSYQTAPNLDVGWGKLNHVQLFKLVTLHSFQRRVEHPPLLLARGQSNLSSTVLDLLDSSSGTHLFVGHDTNLEGVGHLLDLQWDFEGLPNYVPPGSVLRFDRYENNTVTVAFSALDPEALTPPRSPAFVHQVVITTTVAELRASFSKHVIAECVCNIDCV